MTVPLPYPDISTDYADHCYQKLVEAHRLKQWEDAAFYANAISTEFYRIARGYQLLWERGRMHPLPPL